MEINKSVTLNATVRIEDEGLNKVVAVFTANIGENKMNHNINITVTEKEVIEKSPENMILYKERYNEFIQVVQENLI
ncbi:MAG: hypothetical protein K0S61_115 [Anaerocolumna sp.]|nr:hypothetical protein [Anaerocolumna sp.]